MNTLSKAANYASETAKQASETTQATVAAGSKEANKEIASDSKQNLGTRLVAAKDALGDKIDEMQHTIAADVHEQAAKRQNP